MMVHAAKVKDKGGLENALYGGKLKKAEFKQWDNKLHDDALKSWFL